MSERYLVQKQNDLFHRLQPIMEADSKEREAAKKLQEEEEQVANWKLSGTDKKITDTRDNTCLIVGGIALVLLVLALFGTISYGVFFFFTILSFTLILPVASFARSKTKNQHQKRLIVLREQYERTIAELDQMLSKHLITLRLDFVKFVNNLDIWGRPWEDVYWSQWEPATTIQLATRIGTFLSRHELLPAMPAFINCPGRENLLFKVSDTAKTSAYNAIQSIMLRLLALQPPGKVRFTLIDPVGLGQNVAMFMKLTDYNEKLVGNRAWSETRHIEQQLADLSEHMASVIQKYLRGQYATIEEYNLQAGEVAEPYRVLVVTDFPAKFSQEAVGRLIEIATNGPRCGVFTIIMQDTNRSSDFSSDDGYHPYGSVSYPALEQASVVLTWDRYKQRIIWSDPDYSECELQLDAPPALTICNTILEKVGEASLDVDEVKVPFERVILPENEWWSASTRDGLSVPLGRAGASRNQFLKLGEGTAQHVLVAGKTGSGKTNLLHVLLMNLVMQYSPNELELYLIDFKTVGFTPYATFHLPHARVIATKSEREFALSVLKGLDTLLEERKNIFRQAQAQDISEYRKKSPNARMPRILLLVDEFQEFFSYDDPIAQGATLLLDRLVRQGRGFGMHIMLGSQTLAGTYTLASATIRQMGVRIALQCEEADSRLILSEDNSAARLLSRSGEAIYNDKNGMIDGNNPFQCAWLDEDTLKRYLQRINDYAQYRRISLPWQQIIFDGDANANVEKNEAFDKALVTPYPAAFIQRTTAWIGDPLAIKEPVSLQFMRQEGNNLLMVGQQNEEALGMHITTLLSLAAQYPPDRVCLYIFDFMPRDEPLSGALSQLGQVLPHYTPVVTRHTLAKAITEISDELAERLVRSTAEDVPMYLFIYGLQRVRDLRPDDTVGYSSSDDPSTSPNLIKQFTTIVREGPALGIHTIAWCDTYRNLTRSLERNTINEFGLRIVFQMSMDDSNNLIDTPAANTLGLHRAILYNEDSGQLEKFRPYNLPSKKWVQMALTSLRQKSTSPQRTSK